MIDCSDTERFEETKTLLTDVILHKNIESKPLLVLANKVDENPYFEDCDFIEDLDIERLVNLARCPTYVKECSALHDPYNSLKCPINHGFDWLINVIEFHYERINSLVLNRAEDQDQDQDMDEGYVGEQSEMYRSEQKLLVSHNGINWRRLFGRNNKTRPLDCVHTSWPNI